MDAGARRPVVLVHGVRTSSAIWTEQVRALTDRGHPTVLVDLPGHGEREGDRFTLPAAMAAIDEAVLGCDRPPLLVGMSLGGFTSLAYAAARPGTVTGLVLAGCSAEIRGKPVGAYRRLSEVLVRRLRLPGADSWFVVSDVLAALRGRSCLADLRRVDVPVHLVNGARDPMRIDERRFLAARPGTRLTVVPRAGHDVNLHAPDAFNRVLGEMLARDAATAPAPAGTTTRALAARPAAHRPLLPRWAPTTS